jgi:hypothetical protein
VDSRWFLTRIESDGYQCFAFDIIIRHMGFVGERKEKKSLKIKIHRQCSANVQMIYFSSVDRRALVEFCEKKRRRQIFVDSRQMSDNTIA